MISLGHHTKVYLAAGPTDMRRAIDGLAALVEDVLEQDPLSSHQFVFCNRRRDKLKLLFWQHNGFWLWYRRLESQRFWWPDADDEAPCLELSLDTSTLAASVRRPLWLDPILMPAWRYCRLIVCWRASQARYSIGTESSSRRFTAISNALPLWVNTSFV